MNTSSIQGLSNAGNGVLGTRQASFGDNPFLKLLVTQLRSQTPLEPIDNASFTEQLASYSSMEQQQELNDNLLHLLDFQGALARLQGLSEGSALLGKDIEWVGAGAGQLSGTVESVFVAEDGSVRLRVGEHEVDLRAVTSIREPGQDDGDGDSSDA